MRIAVISDIHGNWHALRAVKKDIQKCGADKVFCLGDIVGYGPHPCRCLDQIRSMAEAIIKGNHEDAICRRKECEERLSRYALEGIRFTRKQLSQKDTEFLIALSDSFVSEELNITLAHGALTDERAWKYVENEEQAKKELDAAATGFSFVGHTHVPFVFGSGHGLFELLPENLLLEKEEKFLINVGSVGQPRDGDCRASYGLIELKGDSAVFNLRRVFYNIAKTEYAIEKANLSRFLSERLYQGI